MSPKSREKLAKLKRMIEYEMSGFRSAPSICDECQFIHEQIKDWAKVIEEVMSDSEYTYSIYR